MSTLSIMTTAPGCSLILGGDQHVDNKSHDYTVVRLDRDKERAWHILTLVAVEVKANQPQNGPSGPTPDDTGDLAFEHHASGAIISVNSVCQEYRDASLDELSKYLLLGISTRGPVLTQDIQVDGTKGLESTVEASMSQRAPSGQNEEMPVRVRAIVLRKSGCTYDLMFIAKPAVYEQLSSTFDRFLKGFHAQ
ncbi:MAG: hypothetical protein HY074_06325 [Deltaproteobacteria bacterium]|nr:hypothetical protein [Deltaproteobacteria bacterium]